jgi:hypothetical protein
VIEMGADVAPQAGIADRVEDLEGRKPDRELLCATWHRESVSTWRSRPSRSDKLPSAVDFTSSRYKVDQRHRSAQKYDLCRRPVNCARKETIPMPQQPWHPPARVLGNPRAATKNDRPLDSRFAWLCSPGTAPVTTAVALEMAPLARQERND